MTLDASGNLGVGATTVSPTGLAILSGGQGKGVLVARNATGSPTSGQSLGSYAFKSIMDGVNSNSQAEAMIEAVAAENQSGSTAATNLLFYTKPSGVGPGSSPTERARITSGGNLNFGNSSADRATTAGTAVINIFNGTAPVGTLANGISLYSSSGEAYVMDAAGNATLFSPHDSETNEWIFKSKHTPSGKVLKIDVEKMLRFINDHFGLDAIHEFTEE
jgi:hypothetical protein